MRWSVGSTVLVLLLAAGCDDGSSCKTTCRNVAACKLQAKQGAPMLGEGAMGADPTCMSRCEATTPEFVACEGKYHDCAAVLACIPYADR
jgi:hypothetical protein